MLLIPEKLKQYRQEMRQALDKGQSAEASKHASQISVGRAAEVLTEAPREQIIPCLSAMKPERAGEILGRLPSQLAGSLLSEIPRADCFSLLSHVPIDLTVDLLPFLSKKRRAAYLKQLPEDERHEIENLAAYSSDQAGSIMTTEFFAVLRTESVKDTLAAVDSLPVHHEQRSDIYVIDDEGHPVGLVTLRELLRHPPETKMETVMTRNVAAVKGTHPAADAARMLFNRRYLSLPVIDDDNVMVGIITLEDASRTLNERIADQLVTMNAASKEESFFTPPMGSVRMRLPWMAANIFLNLGAVFIISGFENTIAQVALLAAFLPMITDMGGNVGIQALSVSIRSIALGEVRLQDFWRATRKEITIGLVNGCALGLLFAALATFLQANPWLGLVAGLALGINVFIAGIIGGTLPFLIKKWGKDPAMMTGPVLTTITDITGVTVYLGLSTILLTKILGS